MFSFFLSNENSNFKLNIKYNIFMKSFHKRSKNIEVSSLLSISTQSSFPSSPFPLITQQYLKYLVQVYRSLLTQINFQLFRLHSIINEMHPRRPIVNYANLFAECTWRRCRSVMWHMGSAAYS